MIKHNEKGNKTLGQKKRKEKKRKEKKRKKALPLFLPDRQFTDDFNF